MRLALADELMDRYASMPFDNMKTRMQSVGGGYSGMLDCATKTLKRDGIWAFWRGTGPRLVRLTVSGRTADHYKSC